MYDRIRIIVTPASDPRTLQQMKEVFDAMSAEEKNIAPGISVRP